MTISDEQHSSDFLLIVVEGDETSKVNAQEAIDIFENIKSLDTL